MVAIWRPQISLIFANLLSVLTRAHQRNLRILTIVHLAFRKGQFAGKNLFGIFSEFVCQFLKVR